MALPFVFQGGLFSFLLGLKLESQISNYVNQMCVKKNFDDNQILLVVILFCMEILFKSVTELGVKYIFVEI